MTTYVRWGKGTFGICASCGDESVSAPTTRKLKRIGRDLARYQSGSALKIKAGKSRRLASHGDLTEWARQFVFSAFCTREPQILLIKSFFKRLPIVESCWAVKGKILEALEVER